MTLQKTKSGERISSGGYVENKVEHCKNLKEIIVNLFESNQEFLPPEDVESISELIEYGEGGIAFENLCTQLYEYDCPITQESYSLIEEIGRGLHLNEKRWLNLKGLIK